MSPMPLPSANPLAVTATAAATLAAPSSPSAEAATNGFSDQLRQTLEEMLAASSLEAGESPLALPVIALAHAPAPDAASLTASPADALAVPALPGDRALPLSAAVDPASGTWPAPSRPTPPVGGDANRLLPFATDQAPCAPAITAGSAFPTALRQALADVTGETPQTIAHQSLDKADPAALTGPATAAANEETLAPSLLPRPHAPATPSGEPAGAAGTPQTPAPRMLHEPFGSAHWPAAVGEQVRWLANQQESHAELVLSPPQLGKLEVSLTMRGEQAVVSFVSANPQVREALEAALPRLREVLAEAGIQLGDAHVGAEHAQTPQQQEKHAGNSTSDRGRDTPSLTASSEARLGRLSSMNLVQSGRSLVDVFA